MKYAQKSKDTRTAKQSVAPSEGAQPPASTETKTPRLDRGAFTGFVNATYASDREKTSALCLSCHANQRGQFHQNSRHPVFEGRMTCVDCHDPHRPDDRAFTARADDRCASCHADKRGPFVFAHDMTGLSDGCMTCHSAHGSPNTKLTKLNGRALCLQCHGDINADAAHRTRPGTCWSAGCHADIHGSQTSRLFIATGSRALSSRVLRSPSPPSPLPPFDKLRAGQGERGASPRKSLPYPLSQVERGASPGNSPPSPRGRGDGGEGLTGEHASELLAWLGQASAAPTTSATQSKNATSKSVEVESVTAFQNLGADGNLSKYYQYNVTPRGLFEDARLTLFDRSGFGVLRGFWSGVDQPGQTGGLRLNSDTPTRTLFNYDFDRASFFIEPSLSTRTTSERRNQSAVLKVFDPSTRAAQVDFAFKSQNVNAPGLSRLTANGMPGALSYDATSAGPRLRIPVGSSAIGVGYTNETFTDRTGFLPAASSSAWQFGYDSNLGARTSAFFSFSDVVTGQSGFSSNAEARRFRLGADTKLRRNLSASLAMTFDDVSLPNTANAFTTDNNSVVFRLRFRPERRVSLEGGYERADLRRVNNSQTQIDSPRWNGGWLALRATPLRNVNVTARHRVRRLDSAPGASITGLATTSSLFFDRDDRTDAQFSLLLPCDALLYLNYGRVVRDNGARAVGFTSETRDLGLMLPLARNLTLTTNWSANDWSGRGDVLNNDPLGLNLGRPLISSGDFVSVGLAYSSGKNTIATNLSRFTSSGGESVRGHGLAVSYERQFNGRYGARVQFGFNDYKDSFLSGFNNSDGFIRFDLLHRF